jgi:hypothetical protein
VMRERAVAMMKCRQQQNTQVLPTRSDRQLAQAIDVATRATQLAGYIIKSSTEQACSDCSEESAE